MTWRTAARCLDQDPELFFPPGDSPTFERHVVAAREVCANCQVRLDCLEFALATGQREGVWGGLTSQERREFPHRPVAAKGLEPRVDRSV